MFVDMLIAWTFVMPWSDEFWQMAERSGTWVVINRPIHSPYIACSYTSSYRFSCLYNIHSVCWRYCRLIRFRQMYHLNGAKRKPRPQQCRSLDACNWAAHVLSTLAARVVRNEIGSWLHEWRQTDRQNKSEPSAGQDSTATRDALITAYRKFVTKPTISQACVYY